MFCSNCGEKLDSSMAFCTNCGAPITESDIKAQPQDAATSHPSSPEIKQQHEQRTVVQQAAAKSTQHQNSPAQQTQNRISQQQSKPSGFAQPQQPIPQPVQSQNAFPQPSKPQPAQNKPTQPKKTPKSKSGNGNSIVSYIALGLSIIAIGIAIVAGFILPGSNQSAAPADDKSNQIYSAKWTATKSSAIGQSLSDSITLPAGTYIVIAHTPYLQGNNTDVDISINGLDDSNATFVNGSGNGGTVSVITTLTKETTIFIQSDTSSALSFNPDHISQGWLRAIQL